MKVAGLQLSGVVGSRVLSSVKGFWSSAKYGHTRRQVQGNDNETENLQQANLIMINHMRQRAIASAAFLPLDSTDKVQVMRQMRRKTESMSAVSVGF